MNRFPPTQAAASARPATSPSRDIAGENLVGPGKGDSRWDANAHVCVRALRTAAERCERKEARDAVRARSLGRAVPLLSQNGFQDERLRHELANPFPVVRVARQDRAVAVDHGEHRSRRQSRLASQFVEPGQVERGENHGTDMARVVEDRIAEIDGGLAGDAPDLILADGEVTGLEGAPKKGAVASVHRAGHREGAAEDAAIGVDDSQVGIRRMLREQIGEERVAGGAVTIANGGESCQVHKQPARVLDQPLVIRRNEARQPHGLLLHLRFSELALFQVCVEREPQCRDNGEKDEQQQPRLQTCKRKPRHGSRALWANTFPPQPRVHARADVCWLEWLGHVISDPGRKSRRGVLCPHLRGQKHHGDVAEVRV